MAYWLIRDWQRSSSSATAAAPDRGSWVLSASSANSSTTIRLATSPPEWPPIPSATTNTGGAAR